MPTEKSTVAIGNHQMSARRGNPQGGFASGFPEVRRVTSKIIKSGKRQHKNYHNGIAGSTDFFPHSLQPCGRSGSVWHRRSSKLRARRRLAIEDAAVAN